MTSLGSPARVSAAMTVCFGLVVLVVLLHGVRCIAYMEAVRIDTSIIYSSVVSLGQKLLTIDLWITVPFHVELLAMGNHRDLSYGLMTWSGQKHI